MELGLTGKNAAIAGATRGIGRAIADQLAAEGCNVSICARNQESVDKVVNEIQSTGVKAMGEALDATNQSAQAAWIENTNKELGSLDIFIANVSALRGYIII